MSIPPLDELRLLHQNICQAVGDPRRIQILYAVHEGRRHVSALAETLDVPQPTISRHLTLLRQRGLVAAERDGAAVYYSLTDPRIIDLLDAMRQMLRDILERQATVLE